MRNVLFEYLGPLAFILSEYIKDLCLVAGVLLSVLRLIDGGAVENRTPVRNHATPNVYMFRKIV